MGWQKEANLLGLIESSRGELGSESGSESETMARSALGDSDRSLTVHSHGRACLSSLSVITALTDRKYEGRRLPQKRSF